MSGVLRVAAPSAVRGLVAGATEALAVSSRRTKKESSLQAELIPLEPRRLFAAVSWTGGGDGTSWSNALNWSNNAVPTSSDDVTINAGGNPTIRVTAGSNPVKSLNCADTLLISGGTLTIGSGGGSLSGSTTVSGGTLNTGGNWSNSGTITVSGGQVNL